VVVFMHFLNNTRSFMLYVTSAICSVALKKASGEERQGGRKTFFWHSIFKLPYWLKGLSEIKTR